MTRLLLPFTFGVEMEVLDSLVRLASHQHATLIPLSLIPLPAQKRKGVRLELLQQSKDFLEAVHYKAARHRLPLEPVEIFTRDITHSILTTVEQLHCDGMLLAARSARGSLLDMETIQQLLRVHPCALFVVYFPAKKPGNWMAKGQAWLTRRWSDKRDQSESQHNATSEALLDYQVSASMSKQVQAERTEQEEAKTVSLNVDERTAIR